jgi:FMN-dependent NADH-azoreductase
VSTILAIKSSVNGGDSASNLLVDRLIEKLVRERADSSVIQRDLDREQVPHLRRETLAGIGRPAPQTEAANSTRGLSDLLISELQDADFVIIGAPMYNFGIPSTLKSWFDHVIRGGLTFRFGPAGREGLVRPKPVVVIQTRGAYYSDGPAVGEDAQEPHIRTMLGFIGLGNATFVRVEKLARDRSEQMAKAQAAIDAIGW